MKLRPLIVLALSCICAAAFATSASALQMYTPDYNDDQIIGTDFQGVAPATPIPGSSWDISTVQSGQWAVGINRDGVRGVTSYGFGPGVEAFSIAADGSIASPQAALIGTGGYALAMSPNSDYVYFAAGDSPYGITVAHQAADGSLSYIPGSPFASGVGMNDLAITPDGKYLFAVGPSHTVSRFSIGADGGLTAIGTASVVGAEVMQTSPDGRFLYVMGSSGNDQLHSLSIGADGSLTEIPPAYDMGATSSGKFAVSPNGSRLYVPNSNSNEIVTLASSASGVLSLVGKTPVGDDVKAISASASGELFIVRTSTSAGLYYSKPDPFTTIASTPVQLVSENWNYGLRTAFRPGFGGTAGALKITPNAEPLSFTLDATGSTGFSRLDWSTGSPATVTSTTVTKTKFVAPQAGVIPISVRAVDESGCASELLYTGQLIVCSGNPAAIKSVNYDTPPWVTKLKLSPKNFRSSTKIKFSLTESATVKYRAEAPLKGRVVGKSCKKQTAKRKTGKKCTYWSKVTKNGTARGKAGANTIKFKGKIGSTKLKPGSYRLVVTATDNAKGTSPMATAKFKVTKKKK